MDPALAAQILKTQGPLALALVVFVLAFFGVLGAAFSIWKYSNENMVPRAILETVMTNSEAAADRLCAQQHCELSETVNRISADVGTLLALNGGRR